MNNIILKLKNVTKIFKVKTEDVSVLKPIDLEIKEGEFCIVFGPSGCGKSTLLHIMLGLEYPTTGNVEFMGTDLYKKTEDQRADFRKKLVGMIYQQPNWIKALKVIDNVAFAASVVGTEKLKALDEATTLLQLVGMYKWAEYRPTELSAGQQQKVALARAMMTDPKIIIADEPTGNLDYKSGVELMDLFKKMQRTGKTIIMVTHNLDNIDYATQVIQMFDGSVVDIKEVNDKNRKQIKEELISGLNESNVNKNYKPQPLSTKKKFHFPNPLLIFKPIIALPVIIFNSIRFTLLLFFYVINKFIIFLIKLLFFIPKTIKKAIIYRINKLFQFIFLLFAARREKSIYQVDLIDLSMKNMFSKKSRSIVTMGGMAIGIGIIVFLVSIGYGLESLVISRVATLNEIKQIDAIPAIESNLKITDESINALKNISSIDKVLPSINIIGKVNYQNSSTDVVAYGILSDTIKDSSITVTEGKIFDSTELTTPVTSKKQLVSSSQDTSAEVLPSDIVIPTANNDYYQVTLPDTGTRSVVVNNSLLNAFNINEEQAVGKIIKINYIVENNLTDDNKKIVSLPVDYSIVGVVNDSNTPIIYVPLIDLKQLGVTYYSQVKIGINDEKNLSDVRKQVELLGYKTTSVVDTISQIESLFATARLILGLVGVVALAVAALGMFNTLTVSLLERTHEVGMMKAIGMKSDEVQRLFLTESMIMGLFGGLGGLGLGFLAGKILSLVLSSISITKGYGYLEITMIPLTFVLLVLGISLLVGMFTGIYPASRAKRISALDALRYE